MKRVFFILILCFSFGALMAQEPDTFDIMMGIVTENNDTIIHKNIDEVVIIPTRKFKNKRQQRRYSRYILKVKKVYPLAVKAQTLLTKYEPQYNLLEDKRDRRQLMKKLEKELLAEHKEDLKKWSISDGRILLKLINRETERTPYNLIKDFRGDFSAVFWQGIARIFSNNLKSGYAPEEEDLILEEIVTLIEL
ncbi:MAG: DUF4294 domain-containing protein, partial [Draconibacterium sp.]|nr:DUF4294 domain-containing protein [Draconibacterium sp.]